jgi:hypothetical protein
MTGASAPAVSRPPRAAGRPVLATGRLLRLELRHNVMLWLLPVAAALFVYNGYHEIMALPPLWNLRAMTLQDRTLLDFSMPVAGAAAWMGSRESRRGVTDLLGITAKPRWARQLAVWGATTCWAMLGYLCCVAVVYVLTARQASWGGPLWWPAAVGAAGLPALTAIGFAAGTLLPSRFTAPLVTVAVFFGLGFGTQAASGDHSYWQISPLTSGAVDVGPDPGVATFYHYLPDLSIAQVMFASGLTAALLGLLGWPAGSGGRWLRRSAAIITVAGLAAAGTAVGLAGTGRLDPHGMIVIPALHDAANDKPVRYTAVCSQTAIPVCLNPAYAAYLPAVTAALGRELGQLDGLPGAPARLTQAAQAYQQDPGNNVDLLTRLPPAGATGGSAAFVLPNPLPGVQGQTAADFAAQLKLSAGLRIVAGVIASPSTNPRVPAVAGPAQQAVISALTGVLARSLRVPQNGNLWGLGSFVSLLPASGSPAAAAARFAALTPATRHAWLVKHLAALRAGHISLAQLP